MRERQELEKYLDLCEKADEQSQAVIDPSAVQAALEKLKRHPEPEARLMRMAGSFAPAYNVQTAVDVEHALIVAHEVTLDVADSRQLEPMAEAAKKALDADRLNIVADAGYSNGEEQKPRSPSPSWLTTSNVWSTCSEQAGSPAHSAQSENKKQDRYHKPKQKMLPLGSTSAVQ